jgi:hypothetical protein
MLGSVGGGSSDAALDANKNGRADPLPSSSIDNSKSAVTSC